MRLIMSLVLFVTCMTSAQAFFGIDLQDPLGIFNDYHQDPIKYINIDKGKTLLELDNNDKSDLGNLLDQYKLGSTASDTIGQVLSNTFSMGNGRVDVTYQVKRGTELALKQVFSGYPEYQRLQMTEEILNANFRSHKVTDQFLLDVSKQELGKPSILKAIMKIAQKPNLNALHKFIKKIALALLSIITIFIIFKRLAANSDWDYSISAPLLNGLFTMLVINFVGPGLHLIINWVYALNNRLIILLEDSFDFTTVYSKLAFNWEALIEQTGYLPGLILAIIDILAQFFLYFFLTGLVINIVIGIVLSPLWALALVSDSLKSNAVNSFITWLKTLISVVLISLIYFLIKLILREFDNLGLYFLEISLSITGFVYLPALSSVILGQGQGIFSPAFGGYRNIIDSINNSYESIRSAIELNSNDQGLINQLKLQEDLLYETLKREDDKIY